METPVSQDIHVYYGYGQNAVTGKIKREVYTCVFVFVGFCFWGFFGGWGVVILDRVKIDFIFTNTFFLCIQYQKPHDFPFSCIYIFEGYFKPRPAPLSPFPAHSTFAPGQNPIYLHGFFFIKDQQLKIHFHL